MTNDSTLSQATTNGRSDFLFNYRLLRHGLKQLDVGGGGDCFFKSVSHQLYGDTHHHFEIRSTGIQYMRNNPERFIESVVDSSWSQYIFNMSQPGTWADHIIIQAVADSMNLQIRIIESNPNFTEMTLVEATSLTQNPRSIYIGHIDELHYISTFPALAESSTNQLDSEKSYFDSSDGKNKCKRKSNDIVSKHQNSRMSENIDRVEDLRNVHHSANKNMLHEQATRSKTKKCKTKEQNTNYMRQYRAAIASTEENEKQSAYRRHYRSSNPENKRKNSEYMKQYRSSNLDNNKIIVSI